MGCEVPIVPKGMLENILASEALGRGGGIALSASDWIKNGYHNMPPPSSQLFSGIKLQSVPLLQTNQPGSSSSTTASHSTMPILNSVPVSTSQRTLMNGFGGGLRVLSNLKNEENPSSSNDLEIKRKKRNKNRVNGSSRKKPKTDSSSTDLVLSNGDIGDEKPSSIRSRKRVSSTDRTEKTSVKRQSCKGIKESENDAEHRGVPFNESSLKDSSLQGGVSSGSSGILDIYGLKTMPINLSNRFLDVSINDLLSGKFQTPQFGKLGNEGKHSAVGDSLGKEVNKMLQVMPKPIHAEDNKIKMENSSDLGMRSQLYEPRRGPQYSAQQVASEEPTAMKCAASSDPPFPVGMFPLYPMQDFVSGLELPSDEPLENLPSKPGRQPDISIKGNLHVYSNGSIPPLQHSTSLTGCSRPSLKRDKESKHGSFWQKAGIVNCPNVSCGFGSGFKLEAKRNATDECEQAQREWPNKHSGSETTGRVLMIDLNLQSSEQLLESSMLDSPNSSFFPQSIVEPSGLSLQNRASEGREGETNTGEYIETVCNNSRTNHSIADDESLKRRSVPSGKERDSKQTLHLEAHRSHTTNIKDVKNDIGIICDLKTIKVHENFEHLSRDEDFEDQRQEPNNLNEVQAPYVSDKNASQMDEAAQQSLSDLPALQLGGEKVVSSTGMPVSPRVEAAARILFDMANSLSHFLDNPQEDSCHLTQQESTRSSTIGQRCMNVKTVSHGDLKAVEEFKDTEIKAPTNEKKKSRMPSSIPLVGKYSPKGADQSCQFHNRTFDAFLRKNKTKQGLRDVGMQELPDAKEANDFHIHGSSSRSSKPTTDVAGIGPILCTSNQKRGNVQPKSLTRGKMHVSAKSNQNSRTNNGSHKSAHFEGHIKSPRPIISFTDRKG